jgi:subfamily B ATP-binding cassette protein MsbA
MGMERKGGRAMMRLIGERFHFFKYCRFLGDAKSKLFVAILAGILYGVSSGFAIPVIIKVSTAKIFAGAPLPLSALVLVCLAPVVAMTLRGIFSTVNSYYIGYCGQKILQGLRVLVFDKIQRLPIEYFKKTEPGVVITRSLGDTASLQETIITVSQEIVKQPVSLVGAAAALVFLCYKQSDAVILLIFFLAAAMAIIPIKMVGRKMQEKTMSIQRATEVITTKLSHNLSAVQEIRAFAMEECEVANYRAMCDRVMSSVMKSLKYSIVLSPIVEIIGACGVGLAMFYAHRRNIGPDLFIAMAGALYLSYEPIKKIADLHNRLKAGAASLVRIEDLLDFPEKIHDPEVPKPVERLRGNISFSAVSFSYDSITDALSAVDVEFEQGKTYALVGSSGSGKTTLANLILRFYDVTGGAIAIDGIDIRHMLLRDLRKNISFVPQSPALISGTVADNIRWSVPDAPMEAVVEAANIAYAAEFISQLENGYDTSVGEGGARLSGGQRQRIALARAFLRDSAILILDEATSALDASSEHEVHLGIENLTKNRTSILISHRFSMMSIVDVVFVLEGGRIIEVGTPEELLARTDSTYHSLYRMQQGKKPEAQELGRRARAEEIGPSRRR